MKKATLLIIFKFIAECFDKQYGNTILETRETPANNVHANEGDRLLLDVS